MENASHQNGNDGVVKFGIDPLDLCLLLEVFMEDRRRFVYFKTLTQKRLLFFSTEAKLSISAQVSLSVVQIEQNRLGSWHSILMNQKQWTDWNNTRVLITISVFMSSFLEKTRAFLKIGSTSRANFYLLRSTRSLARTLNKLVGGHVG